MRLGAHPPGARRRWRQPALRGTESRGDRPTRGPRAVRRPLRPDARGGRRRHAAHLRHLGGRSRRRRPAAPPQRPPAGAGDRRLGDRSRLPAPGGLWRVPADAGTLCPRAAPDDARGGGAQDDLAAGVASGSQRSRPGSGRVRGRPRRLRPGACRGAGGLHGAAAGARRDRPRLRERPASLGWQGVPTRAGRRGVAEESGMKVLRVASWCAAGLCAVLSAAAGGGASVSGSMPRLKAGSTVDDLFRANNRGAALMEQFKSAQAVDEFTRVTGMAPDWAPGFVNLGLASMYARQMESAETAFKEAARLDPRLVPAHYGLALLLKSLGRGAEAIAPFEKARALDPDDADILYNLGVLHGRQRQYEPAIAALGRARELDPNNMSIRYQLARALLQSGDTAKGEAEMAVYQKLAANPKFAQPTGNQYGEAGRHGLVITDYRAFGGPPAPPQAITLRFSDATAASGVTFVHGGPGGE